MSSEHELLREILRKLGEIQHFLVQHDRVPASISFHFEGVLVAQPISKLVGQTVNCSVPVEKNAEGVSIPIVVANIAWSSDNTAVSGPITTNPDGSASFVGQAAGVANITVTDTAFNLTDVGACTESADNTPVSISFSFS
jgi:hypothetical protein